MGKSVQAQRTGRARIAILKVLNESDEPLGATRITEKLRAIGVELQPRTVRFYLLQMDKAGLTSFVSRRRGREITDNGREELGHSNVLEKVGFIDAMIDSLAYRMTFDLATDSGSVITNIALIKTKNLPRSLAQMEAAFAKNLCMGNRIALAHPGETLGNITVPAGFVAIGTLCSVTINGILLKAGIPVTSGFGGLLEMRNGKPIRFVELIQYKGTTLDPLETFIRAGMTRVRACAETGDGVIGTGFREIPAAAIETARNTDKMLRKHGLHGILAIGQPSQPLLDIPVAEGHVGLIVVGGLNPIAALHESGTRTTLHSLAGLENIERFMTFQQACEQYLWVKTT